MKRRDAIAAMAAAGVARPRADASPAPEWKFKREAPYAPLLKLLDDDPDFPGESAARAALARARKMFPSGARLSVLPGDRVRYEIKSPGEYRVGVKTLDGKPIEETVAKSERPWFRDVTAHVFGGVASFRDQLAKGVPYWRARLDGACGIDVYGSQGIAAGDIDGDGRDEIYVCQPGGLPNRLYRISDDGRAVDITEASGTGILDDTSCALFLDLDNRGRQDLVVLRSNGPVLFRNEGGRRFGLVEDAFAFARPAQGSFTGMAAADYDGDGRVDLYLCCYVYYLSEDQYRYPRPYHDARNGPPNYLFHNDGGGRFRDVTRESGIDHNNDRYSFAAAWHGRELYVANDFGRNNLYRYDGKQFRDVAADAGVEDIGPGMSAAWFDADGDGRADLYVANMWTDAGQRVVAEKKLEPADAYRRHSKGNSLYRNRGDGTFEETRQAEMGRWAWSADACDFDLDGEPELLIACGMVTGESERDMNSFFWRRVVAQQGKAYEDGWNAINQLIREDATWCGREPNVVYKRRGAQWVDHSGVSGLDFADDSRAFAFVDFDGDGCPDVLLKSRLGPQVRALRNECAAGRARIAVSLRGVESNRDAIGARVEAGGHVQWVSAGSGYLSQHSKTLWFPHAETVRVTWPSGKRQEFTGIAAGVRYTLIEGKPDPEGVALRPRLAMTGGPVAVDNRPRAHAVELMEPVPMPEPLRGPGIKTIDAPTESAAIYAVLKKYLFDWRGDLELPCSFRYDAEGRVTAILPGAAKRAAPALPFPGRYITRPSRNLTKLGTAFYWAGYAEQALLYLEPAARRTPNNARMWITLARIRMETAQWKAASEDFERAFRIEPNADVADQAGLTFAKQGRTDEAKLWFQRAIETDRAHSSAINNLGVLYGQLRQPNDAIAAFEYGIGVAPGEDILYVNLARVHVAAGDRDAARRVLERLLAIKPGHPGALRGLGELR